MNAPTRRTAMASASTNHASVSENELPERSGGRGGLFHLFDWNRRSTSKKKKKVPSSDQASARVSKKFDGDEKMPLAKFLTIADENFGAFPNRKGSLPATAVYSFCNGSQNDKTHSPNLVARLMGLETMPMVRHGVPQKARDSDFYNKDLETTGLRPGLCELDQLQKVGQRKRWQFAAKPDSQKPQMRRSALAHASKPDHNINSRTRSSKLPHSSFDCQRESAPKTVGPILQHTSSAKSAVKCIPSLQRDDGIDASSQEISNEPVGVCLRPQRNYHRFTEVLDMKLEVEEPHAVNMVNMSRLKPSISSVDKRLPSHATHSGESMQRKVHDNTSFSQNDRYPTITSNQNNLRWNQMSLIKDKIVEDIDVCKEVPELLNEFQRSAAFNKNINYHAGISRGPTAVNNNKIEMKGSNLERNGLTHKITPDNGSLAERRSCIIPIFPKQRNFQDNLIPARGHASSPSYNWSCLEGELEREAECSSTTDSKDLGVVSFTSAARQENTSDFLSSAKTVQIKSHQEKSRHDGAPRHKKLVTDFVTCNSSSQRVAALKGDELGALLEQKIRELNCLGQDDTVVSDYLLGRSSASILEDLISALTMGQPASQRNEDMYNDDFSQIDDQSYDSQGQCDSDNCHDYRLDEFPVETATCASVEFSPESVCYQPSPVSTLDASSTSGSITINAGYKLDSSTRRGAWDRSKSQDTGADILASIPSSSRVESDRVPHILDGISIMYNSSPCEIGFSENKPNYAREVFSFTELLFSNMLSFKSNCVIESSTDSLLLNTLETLVEAFYTSLDCNWFFSETIDKAQLRRFLFDSMIEHLDLKYSRYSKSGYKVWEKLSLFLSTDKLSRDVLMDIHKWIDSEGKVLDDIIRKEVSYLTVKWTGLEVDVYDLGREIQQDIFLDLESCPDFCLQSYTQKGFLESLLLFMEVDYCSRSSLGAENKTGFGGSSISSSLPVSISNTCNKD